MKPAYLYFLLCADGTIYTGTTTNLEARLMQHSLGEGCDYTRSRLPLKFLHSIEFEVLEDAARAERQIKKWSKGKKLALMRGDSDLLRELARCRNETAARQQSR